VTDQPVRYLIYSHGNEDHAFGADVFVDTATLIATQAAADKLAALNSPRHPAPTLIVNDFLRLELGGKAVDIHWAGHTQGDDYLIVHYPARRVLFAVDFVPVRSLLFRDLPGTTSIDAFMESLARIERDFDFDVLVPGHGEFGTKDDVRAVREYLLDLTAAVRAARARGLADNSSEMVSAVRADLAPKYSAWAQFETWLPLNITGVIRTSSGN
jgi:glyoxylase-like metal-dependent hydrolase (beta-lactamase superfamily II)